MSKKQKYKIQNLMQPNEAPIHKVWVFMHTDANGDGIVGAMVPGLGATPLLCADEKNLGWMKKLAMDCATTTGANIGLYEFTRVSVEPIWTPDKE